MKNLDKILKNLVENTNSRTALLVNSDGLAISSINCNNEDKMAVMIASLYSMGEKFVKDLDKNAINQFYIKTDEGYVLLKNVNDSVILGLISKEDEKLGLLMMYMDTAVKEISEVI